MQSKRALLIAVVFGALAVVLMLFYTKERIKLVEGRYKPYVVVVAAKDIRQNTIIDESMLEFKKIPEPFVEPNALAISLDQLGAMSEEDLINLKSQRVGYIAAIPIKQDEQITEQKLRNISDNVSASIPKGRRAMTIAVTEITGVAGLIRPADRVDIIGMFNTVDRKTNLANDTTAVTVLQNVEVLSVGRYYTIESVPSGSAKKEDRAPGDISFSNITLLLTPKDCMKLSLAQSIGNLTLTLRPKFDYVPPDKLKGDNKKMKSQDATGINKPLQISPQPKWIEQRGSASTWVR